MGKVQGTKRRCSFLSLSLFFNLPFFIPLSDLFDPRISRERKRVSERETFYEFRASSLAKRVPLNASHLSRSTPPTREKSILSVASLTLAWAMTPSPLRAHRKLASPPSFIDSFNEFLAGNKRCRRKSPYDFGGEIMVRAGERFIKRRQRSDIGWEGGLSAWGAGDEKSMIFRYRSIRVPAPSHLAFSTVYPQRYQHLHRKFSKTRYRI